MEIKIKKDTIEPMINWLQLRKKGIIDKEMLENILAMEDYQIEFARYANNNLPVCTITKEEAIDFFMNFDKKEITNERLKIKLPSFLSFYNNLDSNLNLIKKLSDISLSDKELIEKLLCNGLSDEVLANNSLFNIIFIISIGNSMGWPYENNIDFDLANLHLFEDKEAFLHIVAHEIHHIFFSSLINDEKMTSYEYFFMNFAFEGLAMHFCNNAKTLYKEKKYSNDASFGICNEDWLLYESEFNELFSEILIDSKKCINVSFEEVDEIIGKHYETFEYTSLKDGTKYSIKQYPTYYMGCYMFGIIDQAFSKETLFKTLKNPDTFVKTYNLACQKLNSPYIITR